MKSSCPKCHALNSEQQESLWLQGLLWRGPKPWGWAGMGGSGKHRWGAECTPHLPFLQGSGLDSRHQSVHHPPAHGCWVPVWTTHSAGLHGQLTGDTVGSALTPTGEWGSQRCVAESVSRRWMAVRGMQRLFRVLWLP